MSSVDLRGSASFVEDQDKQCRRWENDYKRWIGIHWTIAMLGIVCSGLAAVSGIESLIPIRPPLLSAVGSMFTLALALLKGQVTASGFEKAFRRLRLGIVEYNSGIESDEAKARAKLLQARLEAESHLSVSNA
jgi:hypothetical protein